ncbi:RNA polymerase sigma-70 factor [Sphingobacterium oryzagri]|uniref:RNA polymerase sigma-70 factor n=1 Tax=Sphingobacterium oryzagri TaxID=3025669 RepID=A0ABY7WMT9_9SPHI|nr:RNA polymerase sigma-70 factor [Sphingobacterium sp. KACC 22765]WDF68654.1 RNA polymerase sigma-70 factor [Sphingobacterium sp. KACC 22765]
MSSSTSINEETFKVIFERYWKALVGFCQHHTDSEEVGMDIVQDIFCSIWKRRDSLVIQVDMEHYLFRAARLKISDYYRKKYSQTSYEESLSHDQQAYSNVTEELIEVRELENRLSITVDRLPARCKQVYRLSRESGRSIPEIATLLNLSEKTVEAHLTKALRNIRARLARY